MITRKVLFLIISLTSTLSFSQEAVVDGSFESGTTPTTNSWSNFNQLENFTTNWYCATMLCGGVGSPDLLDANSNDCQNGVPSNRFSTTRYAHSGSRYVATGGVPEVITGLLDYQLLPDCEYVVSIWGSGTGPMAINPNTCLPVLSVMGTALRRVQIYLIDTNDPCGVEKLVHTSINFTNSGADPWLESCGTFTVTEAEAIQFNGVEIREMDDPNGPSFFVLLDDISIKPNIPGLEIIASDQTPCSNVGTTLSLNNITNSSCTFSGFIFDNYLWSPGGQMTQSIFVNQSGTYTVTGWNNDECAQASASIEIDVLSTPPGFDLGSDTIICFGDAAPIIGPDFDGNFNYEWSTPPGFIAIAPMIPANWEGTYCLEVTNNPDNGCSTSDCIEVSYSDEILAGGASYQGCPGDVITICVQTGFGTNYYYDWGNGPVYNQSCSTVVVNNSLNIYAVTVSNSDGCEIDVEIYVNPFAAPVLQMQSYVQACAGDDVDLAANVNGPYQIIWSDGNGIIGSTSSGGTITVSPTTTTTYTATATDPNTGCSDMVQITVVPLPGPTTLITEITLCETDDAVPFFYTSPFDGINNYTVSSADSSTQNAISITSPVFTYEFNPSVAGPGDHIVNVCYDNSGCCTEVIFHVLAGPNLNPPSMMCSSDQPIVLGSFFIPAGVCSITYSGNLSGINPITHEFDPGTATIGDNIFTACYNYCGGPSCSTEYVITVVESPNVTSDLNLFLCETDGPVTLGKQTPAWINVESYGNPYFTPNASLPSTYGFFSPANGLYIPAISGFITFDPDPSNVGINNITYTVGYNGTSCTSFATGTITVCPEPNVTITATGCDLPVILTANASIAPNGCNVESYAWTDGVIDGTIGTGQTYEANDYGTYSVTVTTTGGCETIVSYDLLPPPPPVLIALVSDNGCGVCEGTITIPGLPNTITSVYVNNVLTPIAGNVITDLCQGTYNIEYTDGNCTIYYGTTNIGAPNQLAVDVISTSTCAGACNGSILLTPPVGGTYSYVWTPVAVTGNNPTDLCAGDYQVLVSETNAAGETGCEVLLNIIVEEFPAIQADFSGAPFVACDADDCSGEIVLNSTTALAPYTITWVSSFGATGSSLTDLCVGTYKIHMVDANGCTYDTIIGIGQIFSASLSISLGTSFLPCPNGSTAYNLVGTVGGTYTAPLTYAWYLMPDLITVIETTQSLLNVCSGDYVLVVTDANGCTISDTAAAGTGNLVGNNFKMTPNPTQGKSVIIFDQEVSFGLIELRTLSGVLLESISVIKQSRMDVDLTKYTHGTYLIHFTTDDGATSKRLIKLK